ncbi:MAG: PorV/PorQ family protein [Melioribacteraceae bacterium]|nr:PorV/PorQ family protein [Melioribacteraceae bacterium]
MKVYKVIILFVILLVASRSTRAQVGLDKLAQSTMNFLLVSISPEASAMGNAVYASNEGALSIFYNPAGLAFSEKSVDVSLNFTQWIADINYLGGAISYNLGNFGVVGAHVMTVDYGTINGASLINPALQFQYPAGYIDNGPISNVGAYSFGISYAKRINEQFGIGGNIRYVGQNLGDQVYFDKSGQSNDAAKLVFDAGVIYNTGYRNFRFGMAIRNFASQIKREEIEEQLPLTFTIGTAIDILKFIVPEHDSGTNLTLTSDYIHSNNYSERVNFGMEYKIFDVLFFRGGYQTNRDIASWSGGIGFRQQVMDYSVSVNYSYSQMEVFDNVNRLSLGFSF